MNAWIRLIRPTSWVKNTLVFSALMFSGEWQNLRSLFVSAVVFVVFCLVASSLYILNDWRDRFRDREHPRKQHRPIAAGDVSGYQASMGFLVLWVLAGGFFLLLPSETIVAAGTVILSYVGLMLTYNAGLKRVAALELMIVSVGILLRALAGAVAIGVSITNWFMLAIFFVSLLLVAGKRRREFILLGEQTKTDHRQVLAQYSERFLDTVIALMAAVSVVTYTLYTLEGQTTQVTARWALPYSVLFVVFGILRYLLLIYVDDGGDQPESIFVSDWPMMICVSLWVGYILLLFRLG